MSTAAGIIPLKVNGLVAPAVRNVDVQIPKTQKILKHSDGINRRSAGQPDVKWTLTCTLLSQRQELLDMLEAAEASGEITLSYRTGAREYVLTDVGIDNEGVSSDSDGTADLTLSGVATSRLRVR